MLPEHAAPLNEAGAIPADARGDRGPHHRPDHRAVPPEQPRRLPRPQSAATPAHHDRRARTAATPSGRRPGCCARPRRSARPPSRRWSASWPPSRILSRGFAPAWAYSAWCAAAGRSGWRLPASAAWTLAPAARARCSRSCATAWIGRFAPSLFPTSCPSSTRTSAAAATTIEESTMLTHPTTDRLRELGLAGMARPSRSSGAMPMPPISASRIVWPCWSSARRWNATASGCPPGCGSPGCANRRPRRTSIIVPPAVSIARCSRS